MNGSDQVPPNEQLLLTAHAPQENAGVRWQQPMLEITRNERKALRRWASIAYDRELGAELAKLGTAIEAWRTGKSSSHAASDEIHQFHDGVARDLFRFYTRASPESAVAQAVVSGVIAEAELPPELLAVVAPLIQFHQWEESARAAGQTADDADRDNHGES